MPVSKKRKGAHRYSRKNIHGFPVGKKWAEAYKENLILSEYRVMTVLNKGEMTLKELLLLRNAALSAQFLICLRFDLYNAPEEVSAFGNSIRKFTAAISQIANRYSGALDAKVVCTGDELKVITEMVSEILTFIKNEVTAQPKDTAKCIVACALMRMELSEAASTMDDDEHRYKEITKEMAQSYVDKVSDYSLNGYVLNMLAILGVATGVADGIETKKAKKAEKAKKRK